MKKFILLACSGIVLAVIITSSVLFFNNYINKKPSDPSVLTVEVNAATTFLDDSKIQDYSRPYVETLIDAGGINGYADNTFKPQGTISKIEFLSMCINSFCDIKQIVSFISNNEYNAAVEKYDFDKIWNGAANNILVAADSIGLGQKYCTSVYDWNKPVTRAEAADMIYNCLDSLKGEKIESDDFDISAVGDKQLIENSGYAQSIKAVYSAGIVQGDAKGMFNPMNNLTREDSAILICKALDKEKRETVKIIPETQETPSIDEEQTESNASVSSVVGERGVKSIKNFIKTAFEPVGKVMYIYGGGWNEADDGAGKEAMTLGLSQSWLDFSSKQNSSYNYSAYNYKKNVNVIHDGLDCSGYIGWILYNVMNDGKGYVTYSYKMDDMLASAGYGKISKRNTYTERHPGDIMASGCDDCKHVYVCLGQCSDGSVLLLHSSPPGVQLTGTYTPQGNKNSEAISLANKYMQKYYPEWYEKFPDSSRNTSYLTHYDKFEWSFLSDAEGYRNMTPAEVLKDIFGE